MGYSLLIIFQVIEYREKKIDGHRSKWNFLSGSETIVKKGMQSPFLNLFKYKVRVSNPNKKTRSDPVFPWGLDPDPVFSQGLGSGQSHSQLGSTSLVLFLSVPAWELELGSGSDFFLKDPDPFSLNSDPHLYWYSPFLIRSSMWWKWAMPKKRGLIRMAWNNVTYLNTELLNRINR